MLNFVQPPRLGRRSLSFCGEARRNKPGGEATLFQHERLNTGDASARQHTNGKRLCAPETRCERIELQCEFAYVGDTKTDEPRAVYLPPVVVAALANHPRGLDRAGQLFRFHDGGRLRDMLKSACDRAGVALPRRTAFHVFRHNYATWVRLYGGLASQSSRPQLLTFTGTTAVHVSFNLSSAKCLEGG